MPSEFFIAGGVVFLMVVVYAIWEHRDSKSPRHGRNLRKNMEAMRKSAPYQRSNEGKDAAD